MSFGENLKAIRTERGLTQAELAKRMGVSERTIISYEIEGRNPKKPEKYQQLASILDCSVKDLLGESAISANNETNEYADFLEEAERKYGPRGKRQAAEALDSVHGLFAGGEFDDEDKEAIMLAIQEIYWRAKKDNKKYTPKKYRHDK